jgi:hypothetical protein
VYYIAVSLTVTACWSYKLTAYNQKSKLKSVVPSCETLRSDHFEPKGNGDIRCHLFEWLATPMSRAFWHRDDASWRPPVQCSEHQRPRWEAMTADVPFLSWRPPVRLQYSGHISDLVEKPWQPTSRCWADVLLYSVQGSEHISALVEKRRPPTSRCWADVLLNSVVSISATSLRSDDSRRPVAELTSSCTVYRVVSISATSLRSNDSRRPVAELTSSCAV